MTSLAGSNVHDAWTNSFRTVIAFWISGLSASNGSGTCTVELRIDNIGFAMQ
jgi:hypothetical protein